MTRDSTLPRKRPGVVHLPPACILSLLSLFSLPLWGGERGLKPASLMPLWSPQAQFAGYYVARDLGIYARHGIDLKIQPAGPGQFPADRLKNGETDFAVLWLSTAIQHRAGGAPFVHLSQTIQKSSLLLVSRKSAGIRTLADMNGRKVGLWEGDLAIPARALFLRHGIKVREIRQTQTVNLFLRGGVDVASAMWYNEYHTFYSSGIDPEDLDVVFLSEQGLPFPEDGLYALDTTVQRDPDLVAAFVAASLEGWRHAFDHPEETLDIVLRATREARLPANRVHQRWMLDRMQDLMQPTHPQGRIGRLREPDYQAVAQVMVRLGLIPAPPPPQPFLWRLHDDPP